MTEIAGNIEMAVMGFPDRGRPKKTFLIVMLHRHMGIIITLLVRGWEGLGRRRRE